MGSAGLLPGNPLGVERRQWERVSATLVRRDVLYYGYFNAIRGAGKGEEAHLDQAAAWLGGKVRQVGARQRDAGSARCPLLWLLQRHSRRRQRRGSALRPGGGLVEEQWQALRRLHLALRRRRKPASSLGGMRPAAIEVHDGAVWRPGAASN